VIFAAEIYWDLIRAKGFADFDLASQPQSLAHELFAENDLILLKTIFPT
jgi:hypothetical protein